MAEDLLTSQEVARLTGKSRAASQAAVNGLTAANLPQAEWRRSVAAYADVTLVQRSRYCCDQRNVVPVAVA